LKSLKILGVYRHPMFSNNAIEADRLILEQSLQKLRALSAHTLDIEMLEEQELRYAKGSYELVLTMAQSADTLAELEKKFPTQRIWNSPNAIRNCYRKAMSNALIALPVGYVPFQILPTDGSVTPKMSAGEHYWLKRSDFHAISDEDVSLAETSQEAKEKLVKFRERGVQEVILQRHIHGDIYKFYGVKGKFFRAIRVRDFLKTDAAPSLVSLERVVGIAADALGLQIYGGDCVLDSAGNFHLIDLNDWPSFRICREEAGNAIAELANDFLRHQNSSMQTVASAEL
jgi:hypothetical protein